MSGICRRLPKTKLSVRLSPIHSLLPPVSRNAATTKVAVGARLRQRHLSRDGSAVRRWRQKLHIRAGRWSLRIRCRAKRKERNDRQPDHRTSSDHQVRLSLFPFFLRCLLTVCRQVSHRQRAFLLSRTLWTSARVFLFVVRASSVDVSLSCRSVAALGTSANLRGLS
jgi:hypothetical protein